ncbi:hypothetical protein [Actinoplanes sp. HUAS TT8]|uniref:hypothetical protein n=1 Tax=Actinoplanes sp. HUAS TT8 TaxID=3447453 RepID=UPI003F52139D
MLWEDGLSGFDVRTALANRPPGVVTIRDFPWDETPGLAPDLLRIEAALHALHGPAPVAAAHDLRGLICADGHTRSCAAFVLPTLLRSAARPDTPVRGELLQLAGDLARVDSDRQPDRSDLLEAGFPQLVFDGWGHVVNRAVEAVRLMIGRDADLLFPLLHDPDPGVRSGSAYTLATALPAAGMVTDALTSRLAVEADDAVQAALVLAIAQHERERGRFADALAWCAQRWIDPSVSLGVRFGTGLAWLGLTAEPAPGALRAFLAELPQFVAHDLLRQLPWWWFTFADGRSPRRWLDHLDPPVGPA